MDNFVSWMKRVLLPQMDYFTFTVTPIAGVCVCVYATRGCLLQGFPTHSLRAKGKLVGCLFCVLGFTVMGLKSAQGTGLAHTIITRQ